MSIHNLRNRSEKHKIIRESYIRLLLVNIVTLLATNLCGFVDNIIISAFWGSEALAAVGYFSPLSFAFGLAYVIILGAVVLAGGFIGSGQRDRADSLFTSSFIAIAAVTALLSLLMIAARDPVSSILGADGNTRTMLADYIAGYAPSIVIASLNALLMSLASFNNAINRSYIATALMFFGNTFLDILLAEPLGLFGIGIASTLSCLISFAVLLPVYLNRSATIRFKRGSFDPALIKQASWRGLPSLLFTAGMLVKTSLINLSLSSFVGYEGIAAANVLGSVCGIIGTLTGGCTNAYSAMASLYYGEDDKEGYVDLFRIALRISLICTAVMTAILAALNIPLAGIFFSSGTDIASIGRSMFILGFLFVPVNVVFNLLMNNYKIQNRMFFVNIMSFAETAMIGVIALVSAPQFKSSGVWLANTWSDLICLAVIFLSMIVMKKRLISGTESLLDLPADFGADKDEYAEYDVNIIDDVSEISQNVIDFCKERGISAETSYHAGLCIEELAINILQHGEKDGKAHHVSIRVVCKDRLTIRIQDDCRKFDPRERIDMYDPETPEKSIGLRLVAKAASDIDYYNNAGINTLIIKI